VNGTVIPEPTLTAEERALFEKGVHEFNSGFYFECHESLEDLWTGVRGPTRDFFQGLIQVSVAFHHLGRDNPAGAESTLRRALARLAAYPDRYYGFDLGRHRAELSARLAGIAARDAEALAAPPSPWSFEAASAG
jgi:predicted metal-dependent hydrolase